MAKTSDAMRQAEKGFGRQRGHSPAHPGSGRSRTSPPPSADHRQAEKFSIRSALRKFKFPSPAGEESPWPEKDPAVITGNGEPKSKRIAATVEEYRRMKHKILDVRPEQHHQNHPFWSSDQGEGNSTVLLHFGQILASEGYRVILVDGNLRRPILHRLLRVERDYGLGDFQLRGKTWT